MRSKKSLLQILDTNWLMLEDAFLLGVHIVLGIDIQQTSFIFCKNAEGVKTISFLYQDCCIILIQHIRSFFLLMEFEASQYVLDFTNHGKKSRNSTTYYNERFLKMPLPFVNWWFASFTLEKLPDPRSDLIL